MCCWTGTGASIAANKVAGVRAALCADAETARGARTWNDANVLALSLRVTSEPVLEEILDGWFATGPSDDPARPRQHRPRDRARFRAGTRVMAVQTNDIVATAAEAEQLELAPLIVSDSLRDHLARELPGDDAPLEFERIGEGHSNITYLVTRGTDRFVLRRPPRPPLPPSAHDVLREWRILDAIKDTPARAPRSLLACDDESVIGAPFYVMEYCVGSVDHERDPGSARHTRGAAPHGPRPRRCARRGARGRLAGMRPRRLRQADRLPRAPAAAVHRPVGVQQDARAAARAGDARLARGQHARVARRDDRARRLPPRQHDGRARRRRRG